MLGRTQFVVCKAQIVGAAEQIHARFQRVYTMGRMATFTREAREPFAHGPIEALDKSGVEHRSAS
ncbi:hypothetical protein KSX_88830 [Ktedonospora formicarum]|uniref:Uncharacterized protein n=1 Tax=Ktedonospora formicarum TaxID=2778364 RepID=A0A8J3MZE7_9CHLR|nr:hypothetical protein KSX_88830 [Ktedonospora formicarum]